MKEKEVLASAKAALKDAFGPKADEHTIKVTSSPSPGLTPSDLNAIIKEVGGKSFVETAIADANVYNSSFEEVPESDVKKKNIADTKKLMDNFREKVATYPKHLSYEGSVVLCVMISIGNTIGITLDGLPKTDCDLIIPQLPSYSTDRVRSGEVSLSVEFDENKDFILKYENEEVMELKMIAPIKLHFFNAVIHPLKLTDTSVLIEQDGEKVKVGNNLVLDRQRIQKLVGKELSSSVGNMLSEKDKEIPRRQVVSGRNAYEIRSDILTLATDFILRNNKYGQDSAEDVITLAKKFYSFVENKR